jgi:hypothetical protein
VILLARRFGTGLRQCVFGEVTLPETDMGAQREVTIGIASAHPHVLTTTFLCAANYVWAS